MHVLILIHKNKCKRIHQTNYTLTLMVSNGCPTKILATPRNTIHSKHYSKAAYNTLYKPTINNTY